jgi:hypothetical protein
VIAQYRIELDSICYEIGKRLLEVFDEVATAAIGIDIVARGYDEIEGCTLVNCEHLLSRRDFIVIAGAKVSNDRESDCVFYRRTEDRSRLYDGRPEALQR